MTTVYTITSGLHDEASVARLSDAFLGGIFPEGGYEMRGADFSDFGTHALDLIYVRTGGAEGIFKQLLPGLLARGAKRFLLLTSGQSNSLAASLEILSYLQQQGLPGEVLHGSADSLRRRIQALETVAEARSTLWGTRLGVIGAPSDWLIASQADADTLSEKLGLVRVDIPMEELLAEIGKAPADPLPVSVSMARDVRGAWAGASRISHALRTLVQRHGLGALTLRGREREDTLIGVLWALGMAGGLILLNFTPGHAELMSYLFGDILLVAERDLWLTAALSAFLLLLCLCFYRHVLATCFDQEFTALRGVPADA